MATRPRSSRSATVPRKTSARRTGAKAAASAATRGRVLVTGASAGIGARIAREFAARGFDLVLAARSRDKLVDLAAQIAREHRREAEVIALDLARPDAPRKLFSRLAQHGIAIEVLVNNAGVLEMGRFAEIDARRHLALVDLNVRTLTELTHLFLPPMIAAGKGRILNVASTAAFQPIPSLASYAATKAYVLSLTESLSEELKGSGVTVTALCPGITDTAMYGAIKRTRKTAAQLPRFLLSDPDDVAMAGVKACLAGEVICVPGLVNELSAIGTHSAPKWLVRALFGMAARRIL